MVIYNKEQNKETIDLETIKQLIQSSQKKFHIHKIDFTTPVPSNITPQNNKYELISNNFNIKNDNTYVLIHICVEELLAQYNLGPSLCQLFSDNDVFITSFYVNAGDNHREIFSANITLAVYMNSNTHFLKLKFNTIDNTTRYLGETSSLVLSIFE